MVTLRVAFLSSMVLELLASLSVALVAVAIGLRLVYGDLTLQVGLAVLILAPGGLPAAAPAGHPVPRRRGRGRGDRQGARRPRNAGRRHRAPARDLTAPFGPAAGRGHGRAPPGERGAVGPLTLVIPAGQITVVTGPSGAGKTTLLQLLAGVLGPDTGRSVEGRPGGGGRASTGAADLD